MTMDYCNNFVFAAQSHCSTLKSTNDVCRYSNTKDQVDTITHQQVQRMVVQSSLHHAATLAMNTAS